MERPIPSDISTSPGVYLYKDKDGRIIYVGKALNLRKRVMSYFRNPDKQTPKTLAMLGHAQSIELLTTTTEKEALLLEASLIKKHRPHYNIMLRDDKQYVLFRLSERQDFPRLEITRQVKRRDGARYYGPFTSGQAARETWKSIHRIFPLRRCSDKALRNRVKPCLYYHIGVCCAPCVGLISSEDYRAMTDRVALLLSGKSRDLLDILQADMQLAAEALDFERAALLRDQIQAIERTLEHQGAVLRSVADADVLGLVTRPDGLALGLIFVRQGMVLDRNTFFWPGLGLEEADELILSFLNQFYHPGSFIPARIVIPWQPGLGEGARELADEQLDEAQNTLLTLEASLSEMRGGSVHIHAPRNADEHRLVDMAKSNAREAARTNRDLPLEERLATVLGWKEPVRRIECVDVSHTGGQSTKVGMVVYEDGKPKKSDYRAYNIEGANGDDYLALTQWAERRFAHGASDAQSPDWPDLLLIDGGKGQLTAVHRVFAEGFGQAIGPEAGPESKIPFLIAGIAKARDDQGQADRRAGNVSDRIFLPGRSNPLPIRPGSAELLFLQAVRDATHDFALGRHRQARAKRAFSGELQRLPGVGPHTAKLLWDNFDSLEAMKKAKAEDIAKLPGIGPKKAEKIWTSLQAL